MQLAAVVARLAAAGMTLLSGAVSDTVAPSILEPTPTDPDGFPFSAPDRVPDGWKGGVVYGGLTERDGVAMREVTFGWRVPDVESLAAVHINSITDRRRENISFALLHPHASDPELWVKSYLLPEDSTWTYRFVSHPELTVDIGATRPGWLKFFSWGKPDPCNPEWLPTPLDPKGRSSVFTGKRAPVHPDWDQTAPHAPSNRTSTPLTLPVDTENGEERLVTFHHGPSPAGRLLILFDGETWRHITPPANVALDSRDYDIILIDNVETQRGRDLPNPEHAARIVEQAIAQSEQISGIPRPATHVVVAGQSFGGLAAASIAVRRPDLAGVAIAQSGSYWYKAGQPRPAARTETPGDLLTYLDKAHDLTGRVIVQVGSDEGDMAALSREFTKRATRSGLNVTHDEWRGGHDYAWWRHGLSRALDLLEQV